ncbi:ROK family protein [Apilactobacillus sp. M161]|uniref:fructokinase n=1 Tax=Apilactobacillus xinyiensis TaxID=2841032 RepID=A0ABT0I1D7_9LACO|nr:ROK family protein [Apilactobacillus xinyiensis]MCK8624530.1 ROK family protein [Apilactobacillus xinyiensis]
MLFGSIEARDDEVTCAVGDGQTNIKDKVEIPLTTSGETIKSIVNYFKNFKDLKAIGVSSFGPIELRTYSPKYGYITDTSRTGWANFNLLGTLQNYLHVPMSFTTDVNSAAYGEYIDSILQDKPILSLAYITFGKGVGAGIINDGEFIGYNGSPEIGHIIPKRHPNDLTFKGICPYQGDCLEGLVSEPAILARTGKSYKEISMFDPIWDIIAYYIAQSTIQATLITRPKKIILGGKIINEVELDKVRQQFKLLFNDYIDVGDLTEYIQMPSHSSRKLAIIGNLSLAKKKFYSEEVPSK